MAWVYVPASAGWNSASNSPSEMPTTPSLTWRGKPLSSRIWSREWMAGSFVRRLSGLTLPPSMADAGVDAWISSLPDSRVSRGAAPASGPKPATPAGSGLTWDGLFGKFDRPGSFLKTSQTLWTADSDPSSTTFPRAGSMRNGTCFQRKTSAHRTNVTGSSSSPWATPVARDFRSGLGTQKRVGTPALAEQVIKWPKDAASTASIMHPGTSLTDAIRSFLRDLINSELGSTFSEYDPTSARLNPKFDAWLMGFPVEWMSSALTATQCAHWRQRMRSALSQKGFNMGSNWNDRMRDQAWDRKLATADEAKEQRRNHGERT